jgi:acetylornithine deacetylase/succinyl-diaminopimelate desuccinylase-like protein
MLLKEKDLLRDLVRIPSVNPAFSVDYPQEGGEGRWADFLANLFESRRWPWLRQSVHPGRDNLLAVCRAS